MLVKKEEAEVIVRDATLIKVSITGKCCRDGLADITVKDNKIIVSQDGISKQYQIEKNVVAKNVYDGDYAIRDCIMTANNVRTVKFLNVNVTPTWMLKLDVKTGRIVAFRRTEQYFPIELSGNVLTVCWFGTTTEKKIRAKIRRKLKEELKSGNAGFVE